ncbi:MAG: hypothetical protein J6031_08440 [Bacteroidales bacterium]|nr:hypothetical protein [Bacteroidales bacterium]
MNTEELIERLHQSNAAERQKERMKHIQFRPWWLAVPAAAALLLMILLPTHSIAEPKPVTGLHVYCNNNCQKDDALEIIRQNISEIQTTVIEEQ